MALNSLIPKRASRGGIRPRSEYDDVFGSFHREMDRLFNRFLGGFDLEPTRDMQLLEGEFMPSVDITENDKEITVTAELPGMSDKDISVTVSKNELTIKGEKKEETEDKGKDYYQMERRFGSFCRVVPLTSEVDENKTDAEFKKGVLTIRMPKTAEARRAAKKVTVKGE
jgi:HSP20 family protein